MTERIPVEGRSSVPAEDGAPVEVLLHVVDGLMNEFAQAQGAFGAAYPVLSTTGRTRCLELSIGRVVPPDLRCAYSCLTRDSCGFCK